MFYNNELKRRVRSLSLVLLIVITILFFSIQLSVSGVLILGSEEDGNGEGVLEPECIYDSVEAFT